RDRLAHQCRAGRERRAGRDRDADHGPERRVVVPVDRVLGGGQRLVGGLHDVVGRQAPGGAADVHRAARGVEAQPHLCGGVDGGGERVTGATREDVVVVGAGGGAGEGEPAETGRGRRAGDLLVEAGPHRVERGEPAEQVVLLG